MKEKTDSCQHSLCVETQCEWKETDIVVIGNGPSAISLSYMLSGWTPYYSPNRIPDDDMLHMRLSWQDPNIPIIDMNIQEISEGLEGRTSNPVALVFDQLCHPYADIGLKLPSQLKWRLHTERSIPHVVIGKAPSAGGVWQNIQGDMKTLSKSNWMELLNMPFKDFLHTKSLANGESDVTHKMLERATMMQVRDYYEMYVRVNGLESNFMNNAVVTSVERVPSSANEVDDDTGETSTQPSSYSWEVIGQRLDENLKPSERNFCIRAKNVAIAVGTSDIPNKLHVCGEELPFVKHSVSNMEAAFEGLNTRSDPILVIGAGLSASDAILAAKKRNLNVIHVFRETPCGNPSIMLKKLPKAIYPEYVWMYELMCGDQAADWYKPYPQFSIKSFLQNQRAMIEDDAGTTEILEISLALVQIGSSPDLSFLHAQASNLGLISGMKIDPKHNPIEINPFTYESVSEQGLYALGPLVGDNFVRFLKGGAFAVCKHLQTKKGIIKL